ncbi:hypothetical protein TL16_g05436 [Triparma laevis f. inornata]|uniref:Rad60/SUMO-like domain-containing protein n=1 Tax=Triparma laevis f. inornata TaxID=1714386 RepID=A0A9W7AD84_9STRA|nr:hypothetical protein TL16_g05436 [Triparma laevis f. inornata]
MSSSDSDSSDSYTFTNTASVKFVSKKKVPPPSDSDSDSDSSDSSTFRSKKNTKKPQPQEQESHTTKEKDIDLVEVDDSFDFDNCASSTPKKKTAALSKAKAIREKLAAAQTNTLIELDSDSDVEVTSPPSTSKNITTLSSSSLPESYATIKLRLNNSQVVPLKINTTLRISSEVTKYITSTHSGTSIKIVFDGDEILAETCQTLDVEDDDQFDVTFTSTEIPRLKIKTTLNGKDYKTWSLKISDNFEKLYEAAGKHYGGVVELTFDGDVINGSSCLEDLDMEEDDVIEVKLVSSKKKLVQGESHIGNGRGGSFRVGVVLGAVVGALREHILADGGLAQHVSNLRSVDVSPCSD